MSTSWATTSSSSPSSINKLSLRLRFFCNVTGGTAGSSPASCCRHKASSFGSPWPPARSLCQLGGFLEETASCSGPRTAASCHEARSPRAWCRGRARQFWNGLVQPAVSTNPPLPMRCAPWLSSGMLYLPGQAWLSKSQWPAQMHIRTEIPAVGCAWQLAAWHLHKRGEEVRLCDGGPDIRGVQDFHAMHPNMCPEPPEPTSPHAA